MATPSPLNRGYSGGLAARGASSTRTPPQNRGYSGGLAAGSRPGGGYGSSFQSSFQRSAAAPAARPQAGAAAASAAAPAAAGAYAPAPYQAPAATPDAWAPWNLQPLPQLGQQSFTQQPASPFGPAPLPSAAPFGGYRRNGGPVQPGQAYVVGEEGPEVIVPQQPGMVVPNQSIASRPARRVGRSMFDIERIAEQRYRRTKNPDMLMSLDYRNRVRQGGQGGQGMMPAAPLPPAAPAGHFVPGRSTGSQVWVRDDLPAPAAPALAQPSAPAQTAPAPMQTAPEQPQAPGMPGTFSPPLPPWMQPQQPAAPAGAAFNPQSPLPPSPLAQYTPAPHALAFQTLPGNPGYGVPVINGVPQKQFLPVPSTQPETLSNVQQRMLTDYNAKNPQSPLQWSGKFEPNGVPVLGPLTQDGKPPVVKMFPNEKGTNEPHEYNPKTGRWRKVQFEDANGNGIDDKLEGGAAPPASGTPQQKTQSGITFQRVD